MNTNGMYYVMYEGWKAENENSDPAKLPENFYSIVAGYLKKAKEEMRMIDLKTLKASLLKAEIENIKRMIKELTKLRCMKLMQMWLNFERTPLSFLTVEEEKIFKMGSNLAREYQRFVNGIIQRQTLDHEFEQKRKNIVLRFLKDTPAIVGLNLKMYGPFKAEDVASLPPENAEMLIQKGYAEEISPSAP